MANLVTKLPITVNNPLLPVIPASAIRPFGTPQLENAIAHWMFDGETPLVDLLNGEDLTPSSEDHWRIVRNLLEVDMLGVNKWLKTGLGETAPIRRTYIACFDGETLRGAATNAVIATTMTGSGSGFAITVLGDKLRGYWKESSDASVHHYMELDLPVAGSGELVFVALSETDTTGSLFVGVGGELDSVTAPRASRPAASVGRTISLSNAWVNQGAYTYTGKLRLGEFAVIGHAMSEAEVLAAYNRSRFERMPSIGHTVL